MAAAARTHIAALHSAAEKRTGDRDQGRMVAGEVAHIARPPSLCGDPSPPSTAGTSRVAMKRLTTGGPDPRLCCRSAHRAQPAFGQQMRVITDPSDRALRPRGVACPRPPEGVPSGAELTLRARHQPQARRPPTRNQRAEAASLGHDETRGASPSSWCAERTRNVWMALSSVDRRFRRPAPPRTRAQHSSRAQSEWLQSDPPLAFLAPLGVAWSVE
jgi:hypothetical protein